MKKISFLCMLILCAAVACSGGKKKKKGAGASYSCSVVMDGPGDLSGPGDFTITKKAYEKTQMVPGPPDGNLKEVKTAGKYTWKDGKLELSDRTVWYGSRKSKYLWAKPEHVKDGKKLAGYVKSNTVPKGFGDLFYCKKK